MGGNSRGPLTEPMFYVLMSFLRRDMCGTEITEFVERKTRGRVKLGPGTLYTLLGKFQDEKLIQETEVDGRKRTYRITPASAPTASPPRGGRCTRRRWTACGPASWTRRRREFYEVHPKIHPGVPL